MRLIDADALREKMYHEAFEKDSDMQKWDSGCWIRFKMFENAIDNAPTIEPPQWIPVTEQPPENDDWVIVTVLDESGDTPYRYTDFGWYLSDGTWVVDNEPMYDDGSIKVIAWMPLPAPWKGGES